MPGMIPLKQAEAIGQRVCELLRPACQNIQIAGSIRRRQPLVKDVEIVALPRLTPAPTLFAEVRGELQSELDPQLRAALESEPRLTRGAADGERYKQLLWCQDTLPELPLSDRQRELAPVAVDLFIVRPPATWGAILAIRTGPADFVQRLMVQRRLGGAMPQALRQHEGQLWRGDTPLDTPTEQSWFEALGLPQWPAEQRTLKRLEEHLGREWHRGGRR